MQAVMISMAGREDDAVSTAQRLAKVGVSTQIFVQPEDWEVGAKSNNRNSRDALRWACENVTDSGFLFVEDDIIINEERFKRAMKVALDLDEVMYFYMHDVVPRTNWYPDEPWIQRMAGPKTRRGQPYSADMSDVVVPEGARLMKKDARMYGTQCVFIPKRYALSLYRHMNDGYRYSDRIKSSHAAPVDTCMINWYQSNGLKVFCYLPHPVQHLQVRTRRTGVRQDVYSKSFGLKSDKEV